MLGLLAMLLPASAEAAAWWGLDRGVSNYGRGGANIVAPQDPIAVYNNPAALAGLRGLQIMIDGNSVTDKRTFQRAPDDLDGDGENTTYPLAANDFVSFPPSPGFFVAYNFKSLDLEALTVALGVFGPPRGDRVWASDGPQRYSEIESHNLQIHSNLAVAYELPWLKARIGGSFILIQQIINARLAFNPATLAQSITGEYENADWDIDAQVDASSPLIPTGVLGASIQPLDFLAFAVSAQLPYTAKATGKAVTRLGEDIAALAEVQGDDIGVQVTLPSILRVAARYMDPAGDFDVEAAFVYETWSKTREVIFRPQIVFVTPTENTPLPEIRLPSHFRDTYSIRLGGQYKVVDDLLALRAGVYYERAAVGPKWVSPSNFDLDKLGVALGARVDLPLGIWIDAALGYVHWMSRDVEGSANRLFDPLANTPMWPIANGHYENYQVVAMLAAGIEIDL